MPKPRSDKDERPIWTSSQLCEALGISSGELGRRVLDGSIKGKVSYGRFDALTAVRSLVDTLSADLARTSEADDAAIKAARLRWFAARAAHSELEQRRGELVPVADVTETWRGAILLMRGHMLAIPSSLAPWVASETNPARCEVLLRERIHKALVELAVAPVVVVDKGGNELEEIGPLSDKEILPSSSAKPSNGNGRERNDGRAET